MSRAVTGLLSLGLISTLGLGGCTVAPPSGPSVMALPAQGKSFEVFQQDDMTCRQFASGQSGGEYAASSSTDRAVGSAVVGTALGAGLGAALGSVGGAVGTGAAVGGAAGLLAGSAVGANSAQASSYGTQRQYDAAYTQCMYAKGNPVQAAPSSYAAYGAPAYAYRYGYPAPYYGPGYYGPAYSYYGPSVVVGGGWGWGGRRRHW